MTEFRLAASDIDGTLVNDQGALSPRTLATLQALLDRGTPVVLVTGLNPWPARRYVETIGHGVRAIALNGTFLLEEGRRRPGRFTPVEVVRTAVSIMVDQGMAPLVFGADMVTRYLPVPQGLNAVESLIAERSYQPFQEVAKVEELFETPPAQCAACGEDEQARHLFAVLQAAIGERAYLVRQPGFRRSWVEVNHPGARKDLALLALAERLGVSREHIVYFGDSNNDLPVFDVIPHAVAVANACTEIKARAWRVGPANHEDGVARVLETLFELSP
ncbi:MAG: HAD family phosphatase [Anaerolineae bacterium]|nr:HAD family phosphatase [Anaerolineae bacterium]